MQLMLEISMLISTISIQIKICVSLFRKLSNQIVLISIFKIEKYKRIIPYILSWRLAKSKVFRCSAISISPKILLIKIIIFLIVYILFILKTKKFKNLNFDFNDMGVMV